ncbi:nucleotide exchange factor GrpE [Salinisphaera sp. Q1T1-3]|uniref:nucleotide exchange factor GrpE n=1 Tax=Salinisphaera sp. Q1T1-3 TaxID=2321229 RepID=UPI000E71FA39|nr:nucleotide exchange factor GrpE [Salinisphaera sp. Q1T1-3]RJS92735.1 nucleotide exchange factor GrpE [Salinisphaera sp. Q1T1-3]
MSQQDKPDTPRNEAEPEDAATSRPAPDVESADEAGDAATDQADPDVETLAAELAEAQAEAKKYREQAVRTQAEMENVRKRAQRETESAKKFAIEKFVTELLGVRDSLELGLQAAEDNHGDFDKLKEGMEMTNRMLASSMEKAGVEVINPQGETFDPEYHEAVSTQPTDELPPNAVASVMQKGYTLNGRVLRAAMVMVAKPVDQG